MTIDEPILALKSQPRNPDRWVALGDVLATHHQPEKARKSYAEALKYDPSHPAAQAGLARLARPAQSEPPPPELLDWRSGAPSNALEPSHESPPEPERPTPPPITSRQSTAAPLPAAPGASDRLSLSTPTPRRRPLLLVAVGGVMLCLVSTLLALAWGRSALPATQLAAQPPTPRPATTPTFTFPPTWTPAPKPFVPGQPTATPPGSSITEPAYLEGQAAFERGDYQGTVAGMAQVLATHPDMAPAYWYRGLASAKLGDRAAALTDFDLALTHDPAYALAYAHRGQLHATLGDTGRATQDWARALRLDPSLAIVHEQMGEFYYQQEAYPQAQASYEQARSIDPQRATSWLGEAKSWKRQQQFGKCLSSVEKAVLHDQALLESYFIRGFCREKVATQVPRERYNRELLLAAKSDYDIYLEAAADDVEAWFGRGQVHLDLGFLYDFGLEKPSEAEAAYQAAIADYTQVLTLDPIGEDSHTLSRDPIDNYALINRGIAKQWLGQFAEALHDFDTSIAYGPSVRALIGRAEMTHQLGRYQEAIAACQEALQMYPTYVSAYIHLADSLLEVGDYQAALQASKRAIALDTTQEYYSTSARLHARAVFGLGDVKQAITELSDLVEKTNTLETYYYLGIVLQADGQNTAALGHLTTFLNHVAGSHIEPELIADARQRVAELQPSP